MKSSIVMVCLCVGTIGAMDRSLTHAEAIEVIKRKVFERKISCVLGISCECPVYLGKCRYFSEHINFELEKDRQCFDDAVKIR